MFIPRLPRHPLLRALAIRQLTARKAMLAAVMADQDRINRLTTVKSATVKSATVKSATVK